ncbi:transglycosylase SLT domain-containing protein, partial [Planktotalea sp.]|uniref:transglycosylase SLT domain-containing protein n=1 Tax=Planktotalea sp. TaxID=2029877 RepID=UPI003299F85A
SWLSSEGELLETALELIAKGERSFDLGCFQLNYRWHGAEFVSLDQMISPKENALYAAKFLKALYAEFGDWTEAAGAYHSRTEEHAKAYKARFLVHYDDDPEPLQIAMSANAQTQVKRTNSYPLLVNRASRARLGSLMPEASQ